MSTVSPAWAEGGPNDSASRHNRPNPRQWRTDLLSRLFINLAALDIASGWLRVFIDFFMASGRGKSAGDNSLLAGR